MKPEKIYIVYESYCGGPCDFYSIHKTRSGAEKEKKSAESLRQKIGDSDAYDYFISESRLYE